MKILFLQIKGKQYGGVWEVNKLIGEKLISKGHEVSIVSIRNHEEGDILPHDPRLNVLTINEVSPWKTYSGYEMITSLKKGKFKESFMMLKHRLHNNKILKQDKEKLNDYIRKENPDYLISSHYQLIEMIDDEFYDKLFHLQHSSFKSSIEHLGTKRVINKYKDKIKFLWLSQKTMENASLYGIKDNYYIYNAVRFETKSRANVIENKKIVTIARFSSQKRIDIMIKVVSNIFNDLRFKNWVFEIYGSGEEEDYLKSLIKNHKQIKIMGKTDNPKEVLLTSSINLNTSLMEGFCLSILEANECGVPTVSLDFGESVSEEILDDKTGLVIYNDNLLEYEQRLRELMLNSEKLELLSKNCKEFNKKFHIDSIIKEWEMLLVRKN